MIEFAMPRGRGWTMFAAALVSGACSAAPVDEQDDAESILSQLKCAAGELDTLAAVCEVPSTPFVAAPLDAAVAPEVLADETYGVHLISQPTPSNGGALSFVPTRSGPHTVYLGTPKMPFAILTEATGEPVAPGCVSAIAAETCQNLRRAYAFSLEAGVRYRIAIGPISPQRWLRLRIAAPPAPPPIVFAAALNGAADSDLYSIEADGSGLHQLTATPLVNESFPRWAPDAQRVAYMTEAGLMVAQADGSGTQLVTAVVGRGTVGRTTPAWSPDGQRLAYAYPRPPFVLDLGEDGLLDESYKTTLHVIGVDGTGDTSIPSLDTGGFPPGIGTLTEPAWSSTGLLAFRQADDCPDCAGGAVFSVMHEDGSDYHSYFVDTATRPDHEVDWSPDATRWAYVQLNPRDGRIAVSRADETQAQQLTSVTSKNPRWSPAGNQIAFVGSDGLFVMDTDGQNQRLILAASDIRGMDW